MLRRRKWTYRASRPHRKLRAEQRETQFGGMTKVERLTDRILTPTDLDPRNQRKRDANLEPSLIKRHEIADCIPLSSRISIGPHYSSEAIFQRRKVPSLLKQTCAIRKEIMRRRDGRKVTVSLRVTTCLSSSFIPSSFVRSLRSFVEGRRSRKWRRTGRTRVRHA